MVLSDVYFFLRKPTKRIIKSARAEGWFYGESDIDKKGLFMLRISDKFLTPPTFRKNDNSCRDERTLNGEQGRFNVHGAYVAHGKEQKDFIIQRLG